MGVIGASLGGVSGSWKKSILYSLAKLKNVTFEALDYFVFLSWPGCLGLDVAGAAWVWAAWVWGWGWEGPGSAQIDFPSLFN